MAKHLTRKEKVKKQDGGVTVEIDKDKQLLNDGSRKIGKGLADVTRKIE